MPDLDVRITSMYPPGVQGRDQSLTIRHNRRMFAVRGIKNRRGRVRMGFYVYAQPENTGWIQGYLFSCDGGIPQRAENKRY